MFLHLTLFWEEDTRAIQSFVPVCTEDVLLIIFQIQYFIPLFFPEPRLDIQAT